MAEKGTCVPAGPSKYTSGSPWWERVKEGTDNEPESWERTKQEFFEFLLDALSAGSAVPDPGGTAVRAVLENELRMTAEVADRKPFR